MRTKYPQGGEKQLINAVTKHGFHPRPSMDYRLSVVQNVGTALAVYDAIVKGVALYQRGAYGHRPTVSSPKTSWCVQVHRSGILLSLWS